MSNLLKIIGLIAILIIGFTIYQKCTPDYIDEGTQTVTEVDTTLVDSLKSVIEKYESIPKPERDTITDTVYIEKPVYVNDSTNRYTNFYSDSTLDATITSEVSAKKQGNKYSGYLTDQIFSYTIKKEKVRTINNTVKLETVKTVTKTRTLRKNSKPFFSIGGNVSKYSYGPTLSYNTSNDYSIGYYYDLENKSHGIAFSIPIKF